MCLHVCLLPVLLLQGFLHWVLMLNIKYFFIEYSSLSIGQDYHISTRCSLGTESLKYGTKFCQQALYKVYLYCVWRHDTNSCPSAQNSVVWLWNLFRNTFGTQMVCVNIATVMWNVYKGLRFWDDNDLPLSVMCACFEKAPSDFSSILLRLGILVMEGPYWYSS